MVKRIISGVLLLLLIFIAIVQAIDKKQEKELPGLEAGVNAPDFTLRNLEGESVSLADYKGKIVILNFWATWCGPCRKEMPDLEKYYREYNQDVVVLAVNTDSNNDVKGFADGLQLTFPIVLDEKSEILKQYEIISYPTTYFIDKKGVIQAKQIGEMNYELIKERIRQL